MRKILRAPVHLVVGLLTLAMLVTPVVAYRYVQTHVRVGPQDSAPVTLPLSEQAERDYAEFARGTSSTLVVVGYHDVIAETPRGSRTATGRKVSLPAARFDSHLRMLKLAGFVSVTASQVIEYMTQGASLPTHAVLISFDGSHSRDWILADPILRRYGFGATVFVDPVTLKGTNKRSEMSWAKLRAMVQTGRWEVGVGASAAGLVPVDASGTRESSVLAHRWLASERRLETTAEFQTRIRSGLDSAVTALVDNDLPAPRLFSYPMQAGYPLERVETTLGELVTAVDGLFPVGVLTTAPDEAVSSSWVARRTLPRLEVYQTTSDELLFSRIRDAAGS